MRKERWWLDFCYGGRQEGLRTITTQSTKPISEFTFDWKAFRIRGKIVTLDGRRYWLWLIHYSIVFCPHLLCDDFKVLDSRAAIMNDGCRQTIVITYSSTGEAKKIRLRSNNLYFHQLVNKIKMKCLENFTTVPTCFGMLNTLSLGEHSEHWALKSAQAQLLKLLIHNFMTQDIEILCILCNSWWKHMLF